MSLAFQNLLHDRTRFLVTALGVAFAVFLMIFQGSLLVGFLRTAAEVIDAADSDIWITARGVNCFDFSATMDRRFREIAQGVPGVASVSRVSVAFANYRKPDGQHQIVVLVGADPNVGSRFPLPYLPDSQAALEPEAIVVDESNADSLGIHTFPTHIEINGRRAHVSGKVRGFASFLGSPYVFTSYEDAARYSKLGPEETVYLILRVTKNYDIASVKEQLTTKLPEVDVWTQEDFGRRSQIYWVSQTGAGAAILTAAVLAFLIGLVVVSQTIYATTMEHLDEFATLKALGASRRFVINVVLNQSLACCAAGCLLGLSATIPMVAFARRVVAWIYTPWWLVPVVLLPSLLMCVLASIMSIRTALSVEPARVFRA
jgi:putative ABC transport system permease protein